MKPKRGAKATPRKRPAARSRLDRGIEERPEVQLLFRSLKTSLRGLSNLLGECSQHWGYEDPVYRFYHHSFKVYRLQEVTGRIVEALQALSPNRELNQEFTTIVQEGTGHTFKLEHNRNWLKRTRPIVEAFFHARFFLEMAVRYGRSLRAPPHMLPSGWAAFLYLYGLR
jgi:hypothetical protein